MSSNRAELSSESNGDDAPTVLIVEDEDSIRSLYVAWLKDTYIPRTAATAAEALKTFDTDVDVVLLDRDLPDRPGSDVLEELRTREADCRVVMVTSTDPDVDVIDMEFDEYLTKPIEEDQLHEIIEAMLVRSTYDDLTQEYYAIASKQARLMSELGEDAGTNQEYQELEHRRKELESELDESLDTLEETNDDLFEGVFHDLEDDE